MLVSEVLERTETELLHAGGLNIPAWDKQSGSISDSSLALTVAGTRVTNIPNDSVIEWDDTTMEAALVDTVAGTAVTLFNRGHLETTAATHSAGTRVIVNNPWPKIVKFNALVAAIRNLRSYGLYVKTTDTSLTYSETAPVDLNSSAYDVMSHIWVQDGTRWMKLRRGEDYEVIFDTSPIEVQFFGGGYTGAAMRVPYKKDFTIPTALTDNLDTANLPASLQPHLPKGVAAYLLQGKEVPRVQAEHIRRTLEAERVPVGSLTQIGRGLEQAFEKQLLLERTRQRQQDPTTIVMGG